MLVVLKKVITFAVYPITLCLTLLVVGLFFIWFTRRQRSGKIILTIGVIALTVFSLSFLSNSLLGVLENKYPPLTDLQKLQGVKWIVVLGGGIVSDSRLSANDQISGASLSRLVEGIRIHKNLKGSKLILSGGAVFDPVPEAKVLAEVAISLGVREENLLLESVSKDTEEQAQNIQKIAKRQEIDKFVLVTSASHMPRAVALFNSFGMHPVPAPIDFQVKNQSGLNPRIFFPSSYSLIKMENVFHEYLGIAWARLKPKSK